MTAAQLVPERDFQRTLTEALDTFGWSWNHTFTLRTKQGWRTGTTAKGWPDLVCLRDDTIVAIEVKGDHGVLTPEQAVWLGRFAALAHGHAWVVRPRDDFSMICGWLARPDSAPTTYGWADVGTVTE